MDNVNKPQHYTKGGIECIEAIRASMTDEQFLGYCKGNVMKYTWRFEQKNGIEDLEKAKVYLNWMIETKNRIDNRIATRLHGISKVNPEDINTKMVDTPEFFKAAMDNWASLQEPAVVPHVQVNISGGDRCPLCNAPEVPHNGPRTLYACGSHDYDQRPGTFCQGVDCIPSPTDARETHPVSGPIEDKTRPR